MTEKREKYQIKNEELNSIIEKGKDFFVKEIIPNHIDNTKKLSSLKEFNLNPFLDKYKANFLTGNVNPKSIAKALVYPRALGYSINTTFGNKLQKFCSEVLEGYSSTTSGIDIEYIDKIDGHKKFCQIKAGPNTINKDDVTTIKNHFNGVRQLARTNGMRIAMDDLVVGVLYGTKEQLSGHYKVIDQEFPVHVGKEFWYRLSGEIDFYERLTDAISEIAVDYDGSKIIEEVIDELAGEIAETSGFEY